MFAVVEGVCLLRMLFTIVYNGCLLLFPLSLTG